VLSPQINWLNSVLCRRCCKWRCQHAALEDSLSGLTPKERQIALLLRQGASNKQLALELDVGLPTIKTHLINLFRKTGVTSRTELVGALFL
jgi:DNA-binding CsgD family transcriptional regulator